MNPRYALLRLSLGLSATLFCVFAPRPSLAEDTAIVVGVGDYANLGPRARLPGIDKDVNNMERAFTTAGFRVIRLLNQAATREGITQAFQQARSAVRSSDRFVYYQSSHGDYGGTLLTYNTTSDGRNSLRSTDVRALMAQIPTRKKSVIMDACFSGGFKSRGAGTLINKFYSVGSRKVFDRVIAGVAGNPPTSQIRDRNDEVIRHFAPAAPAANTGTASADGAFVVFASSQADQPSLCGEETGSVFTYVLTRLLGASKSVPWNTVVQPTLATVAQATQGRQVPVFKDQYLSSLIYTLDAPPAANAATFEIGTLGEVFDRSNTNGQMLELFVNFDKEPLSDGSYMTGTGVRLNLHVGHAGYLFLVNRDDTDSAQMCGWGEKELSFDDPEKMVEESFVGGPENFEYGKGTLEIKIANRNGEERWKAFLFTKRDVALAFARAWSAAYRDAQHKRAGKTIGKKDFQQYKLNNINRRQPLGDAGHGDSPFYTSDTHYRVSNGTAGADGGKIE